MKLSQSQRVLSMLRRLLDGQLICTAKMAEVFDESGRTLQRDMKLLRDFLGDALVGQGRGCYRMVPHSDFARLLEGERASKKLHRFFEFLTLLDANALDFFDDEAFSFLKELKRESDEIYTIFDNPIEELERIDFLDEIKSAIKGRRYCDLVYNEIAPRELKNVKPLRILYAKNNWYLAAMTQNYKHNSGFKRFRINFIEDFSLTPQTFHRDVEAEAFIKSMRSLFEDYKIKPYTVTLHADKEIARHFRVKMYLSSQKIVEDRQDGSLILAFEINNDMEILPLVRQWIPHLKILSPDSLKMRMKRELEAYLGSL